MAKRPSPSLSGLAILLGFATAAASATAAPTEETPAQRADRLFDESKPLLGAGRYAEACPKLSESQSLDPATGTLLALALCHEGEGKTASAFAELGEVVTLAKKEKRADRVKLATQHIAALGPVLSHIQLSVPPEVATIVGLTIERDGRAIPAAEWNQATPADPGEHVVGAAAPGRSAWRTTFVLPKQETKTVTVGPLPPVAPTREEAAVVTDGTRWKRQAGLITLGGGAVALAVGVAVGIDALVENGKVKDLCPGATCTAGSPGAEKSQTVQAEAWASDVALGLGAVAAGIGAYLLLTAPKPPPGVQEAQGLRVVPLVAWGRAGVSLSAAW
jgi:hypothetical protein